MKGTSTSVARHLWAAFILLAGLLSVTPGFAQGALEHINVLGPSLEGNLQGNDPVRDVHVYLPAGYASSNKRYPVVYFLHGYAVTADIYVNAVLHIPEAADAAMAAGALEAIIVMPDAFTAFGGSFYASNPTIGDWESWIAKDLVSYIDSHYRTIASRAGRGLSGHSMGGYGTLRIGMKYPEVFQALYAMSAGGLLDPVPTADEVKVQLERMAAGITNEPRNSSNGMQAKASAWTPNPQNPPYYFDLPFNEKGEAIPLVAEKWNANVLLLTLDQNVPALLGFSGIMLDVGNQDSLEVSNSQLSEALHKLGVDHRYDIYEGNHGNRVGQRFMEQGLAFFARYLQVE